MNASNREISVLIVDDSPSDRSLAAAHVENANKPWTTVLAESGRVALERMSEAVPDVVITDLRMPEMDGIELIEQVHLRFPETPVVIMTSRGSEALAVEALEKGAASYIPKNQLDERLVETIEQVVDLVRADANYQNLIDSMNRSEFEITIENDPQLIPPLVDLLQQMTYGMNIVDTADRRRVGIALDEALLNAMYHGNLELPPDDLPAIRRQLREGNVASALQQRACEEEYRDRRINVVATINREEARFTIRDDGMGFHPGSIPKAQDPHTLEAEGGRGLVLMANFVDALEFNEMGNSVTLVKRTPSEE